MNLNKNIETLLLEYLKPYLATLGDHFVNTNGNTIEISCKKSIEDVSHFLLIRMGFNEQNEEIYIFNIYIPQSDRGNRIGLGLIEFIFKISKAIGFALVLADMTDSFREAMLRRGAITTLVYDCLQIIDSTDLS